ncbi:DUF7693 family protein [Pseudomonas sp. GB2N2]
MRPALGRSSRLRQRHPLLRDAALEVRPLHPLDKLSESGLIHVDIDSWQRYGTDPVSWLSTWELAQIERLLSELKKCGLSALHSGL